MSGNITNAADTACKDGFCQFTAVKAVYPALYRLDSALYRRCFILRRRCQKISFCKSTTLPGPEPQEKELTMIVNGMALDVSWEDNETVEELLVYAQNGTITVNTTIYGGFEQVGSLPQSFSRNDVQMTTEPRDIVLYSGNQLVVFFSSNTWNYTKLGHINLAAEKLAGLLGGDSAVIEVKYE